MLDSQRLQVAHREQRQPCVGLELGVEVAEALQRRAAGDAARVEADDVEAVAHGARERGAVLAQEVDP